MTGVLRYLRRHHVAMLALMVGLGGTAYAATTAPKNSVTSKSIRNGQVRAADIGTGQVRSADVRDGGLAPVDLALIARHEIPEERSITAVDSSDEFELEASVGPSGLVSIFASSRIRKLSGEATSCGISVRPPGGSSQIPLLQNPGGASANYFRFESAPGTDATGVAGEGRGGWVVFRADPGSEPFEFRLFGVFGGSCRFQDTLVAVAPH